MSIGILVKANTPIINKVTLHMPMICSIKPVDAPTCLVKIYFTSWKTYNDMLSYINTVKHLYKVLFTWEGFYIDIIEHLPQGLRTSLERDHINVL